MRLSIILIAVILLASCSPELTMIDTSCAGYKKPEFSKANISTQGIAIMPVLGGNDKEEFRRPVGDKLNVKMKESFGDIYVKSTQDVINSLNTAGLSSKYTEAIQGYTVSGIVPRELVQEIGKELEVSYVMYSRLLGKSEASYLTGAYGFQSTTIDELYMQTQVWDTQNGDVVWEGKGGVATISNQNNIIDETTQGLANVVGLGAGEGPCGTNDQLKNAIMQANTNTWIAIGLGSIAGGAILGVLMAPDYDDIY